MRAESAAKGMFLPEILGFGGWSKKHICRASVRALLMKPVHGEDHAENGEPFADEQITMVCSYSINVGDTVPVIGANSFQIHRLPLALERKVCIHCMFGMKGDKLCLVRNCLSDCHNSRGSDMSACFS